MTAGPLLQMQGIVKAFPGVQALRDVDLTLQAGEVLALLGENGAGKSTLMKILGGAVRPDAGSILLDGRAARIASPHGARRAGIALIHQELNLVPSLSARENVFLGQEKTRGGFLDQRSERQRTQTLLQRLGVLLDPDVPCRELSVAGQQIVEIAKALAQQARILIMDEPTAALTAQETDHLFGLIRELKTQGIGIIYISHRLDEVFALADRILVLRDGRRIGERLPATTSRTELIELMVGRKLTEEFPKRQVSLGPTRLEVRELRRGRAVRDVSFQVRRGEILGLAGLVGAGRTETARLIFGADRRTAGEILLDGRPLAIQRPRDAIEAGIVLLPEDRKTQGLVLQHSLRHNLALPNLPWLARFGFIRGGREQGVCTNAIERLRIKTADIDEAAERFSGGNQQKIVLAKWLARDCQVLLCDEPTRGIDVGAKYEVYQLLNEQAAQGKAIVFISSELPELLGMADRILVMHEGRVRGEIADVRRATQEQILALAVGEP